MDEIVRNFSAYVKIAVDNFVQFAIIVAMESCEHDFQPRYNEKFESSDDLVTEDLLRKIWIACEDVSAFTEAMSLFRIRTRNYVCDVCTKCGASTKS